MISLLLPLALALSPQTDFALHEGDRVLFYGDSITDDQYYPKFVETYVVSRFPNMRVSFLNYGWSGDRVGGGGGGDIAKRLNRDVFPFHPSVVTIMLGMNDGSYRTWDDGVFRTYSTGYEHILDELKGHGNPRVTLIQPSPYDDVTLPPGIADGGYNAVLRKYGDYLATLAPKVGASICDFNTPVVDMLTRAKAIDPDGARKLIPDRVHPTAAAHIVMGAALLKTWRAPGLVSSVEIDGSTGQPVALKNASLRNAAVTAAGVEWSTLEGALPLYVDRNNPAVALVLKSSSAFQDLDQETLRVTKLAPADYALSIDGKDVGKFTADQLASGIDLTVLDTPMLAQAAQVATWTARRQYLRQLMWRGIVFTTEDWSLRHRDESVKALESLEADVVERQRQTAKPVWHNFTLRKLT